MKPEDRRELETSIQAAPEAPHGDQRVSTKEPPHKAEPSVIAEKISDALAMIRQRISRNMVIAGSVILFAILLFIVWRYVASLAADRNAGLWFAWERAGDLDAAQLSRFAQDEKAGDSAQKDIELALDRKARAELLELEKFANEHKNTMQGRLARFQVARALLFQGLRDIGSVKILAVEPIPQHEQAVKKLQKAAELYKGLADESIDVPLLAQESLLNSGKAYEAVGDLEKAKSSYQQLIKNWPKSVLKRDAETGVKRLENAATVKDIKTLDELLKPSK
jgi:tetratricopeptide (TPR) repeat protein